MSKLLQTLWLLGLSALAVAAPPPGHPSTAQAAQALGLDSSEQLVAEGRVRAAYDSNAYTYIQVEMPSGELVWLAAPRVELQVGRRIGFGAGRLMHNFYSKKLQRAFARIHFVSSVQILPE